LDDLIYEAEGNPAIQFERLEQRQAESKPARNVDDRVVAAKRVQELSH